MSYPAGGWRSDRGESPAGGMGGMGIHMVDAVSGAAPYPLPNDQAIHGVTVFEAVVQSANTDQPAAVG